MDSYAERQARNRDDWRRLRKTLWVMADPDIVLPAAMRITADAVRFAVPVLDWLEGLGAPCPEYEAKDGGIEFDWPERMASLTFDPGDGTVFCHAMGYDESEDEHFLCAYGGGAAPARLRSFMLRWVGFFAPGQDEGLTLRRLGKSWHLYAPDDQRCSALLLGRRDGRWYVFLGRIADWVERGQGSREFPDRAAAVAEFRRIGLKVAGYLGDKRARKAA
jgi:hypothetical protein